MRLKLSTSQLLNIISLIAVTLLGLQLYLTCPPQNGGNLSQIEKEKFQQSIDELTKLNAELRGLVGNNQKEGDADGVKGKDKVRFLGTK